MGVETKIQWTHHTFNPWRGCTKVSPGCQHCYAEATSKRNPTVLGEWGPGGRRAIAAESYWRLPLRWDRAAAEAGERRRVFCASLADVFEHNPAVEAARARLFTVIDSTPNLDWLLLTKRPENILHFWHTHTETDEHGRVWGASKPTRLEFRRDNVWLGTSIEDQQRANERLPELFRCRKLAAVLFVSLEPLLGPVDLLNVSRWKDAGRWWGKALGDSLDWAIIGGESGHDARPCDLAWVRSLIGQCFDGGVAPFVKQLGARPVADFDDASVDFRDPKGGDPDEWPADLRVREFPVVTA